MGKPAGGDAAVLVVGAGPAGLVLGNLLLAAGIDCVIIERRSREHVEHRARAGFLAANSVRVLAENGLDTGLRAHGKQHDVCAFRGEHGEFELKYSGLGRGEVHTVYPQQDLVRDLIAEFLDRGGDILFERQVTAVHDVDTVRPALDYRDADGTTGTLTGRYLAGCDGQHGVSRTAVRAERRYQCDHGVSWLAVLAEAPQSMAAVTYAIHEHGFAGHMARSPSVTRYYLQCTPGDGAEHWSDQQIWDRLNTRMRVDQYGPLRRGPLLERRVVHMTSHVMEPIAQGSLFLAGDAASLISPSAAKGANLAIMEAEILATGLITALRTGDDRTLGRYSADCLPRIWHAQEFSQWLIHLLHGPPGDSEDARFQRALQRARLASLRSSRAHQDFFAENYVGI